MKHLANLMTLVAHVYEDVELLKFLANLLQSLQVDLFLADNDL